MLSGDGFAGSDLVSMGFYDFTVLILKSKLLQTVNIVLDVCCS